MLKAMVVLVLVLVGVWNLGVGICLHLEAVKLLWVFLTGGAGWGIQGVVIGWLALVVVDWCVDRHAGP